LKPEKIRGARSAPKRRRIFCSELRSRIGGENSAHPAQPGRDLCSFYETRFRRICSVLLRVVADGTKRLLASCEIWSLDRRWL